MTEKNKGEVVAMPKRAEVQQELTPEQVAEIMRQDEQELDLHLSKFKKIQQPDASGVKEEEDEEEETITLDFGEGGEIKAYEKVGEGVLTRGEDGELQEVDEATAERVLEMIQSESPKKPERAFHYEKMIRDRFVSKAIASLMKELVTIGDGMEDAVKGRIEQSAIGAALNEESYQLVSKRKDELRKAWSWNGDVQYEMIPEWAVSYIDEYIQDAIGAMLDFVERD